MAALLRDAGVVEDEDGIETVREAVGHAGEFRFERGLIPQAIRDKMVEAVVPRRIKTLGHGPYALAFA